jgi:hypothetical protein
MSRPFRPCYVHPLWRQIVAADHAWQDELERVFRRRAGDARYDGRGRSTPRLLALHRRLCRLKRRAGMFPPVAATFYRRAGAA